MAEAFAELLPVKSARHEQSHGRRGLGILGGHPRRGSSAGSAGWNQLLCVALVLLVVVSAVRYTSRHGMSARTLEVLGGAALLLVS